MSHRCIYSMLFNNSDTDLKTWGEMIILVDKNCQMLEGTYSSYILPQTYVGRP